MDGRLGEGPFATWLYRLCGSPEWRELQARYLASMTERAISGGFDEAKVAEFARDQKGLRAFALWCENEVSRKAGAIDGRATRYRQRAGHVEGKGEATGGGGAVNGRGRSAE
jgi:hypothetical protein